MKELSNNYMIKRSSIQLLSDTDSKKYVKISNLINSYSTTLVITIPLPYGSERTLSLHSIVHTGNI